MPRRTATPFLLLGLLLLLVATAPAALGRGTASPATGHAAVIAQGVAAMPRVDVAWRVVAAEARREGEAPAAERTLGFVVAGEAAVLVTDEGSGRRALLGPGEAAFAGQGEAQRRASTGAEVAPYYGLELVVAEAAEDPATLGDADLVFAGDPFDAPRGERDLNLIRDTLEPGEASEVDDPGAPSLVLVTDGAARVVPENGPDETLMAGEAGVYAGAFAVEAGAEGGASFVAALIGERVGGSSPADESPEPGAGATFAVETFACPAGVSIESGTFDDCVPSDDSLIEWSLDGEPLQAPLTAADAMVDGNTTTWTGLPEQDAAYRLTAEAYAPGYAGYVIPSSNEVTRQDAATTEVFFRPALVTQSLNAYVFLADDGAAPLGQVAFEIRSCPPGIGPDDVSEDACETGGGDTGVDLYDPNLYIVRAFQDAVAGNPGFAWQDVPFGNYVLFVTPPIGNDGVVVPGYDGSTQAGFDIAIGPENPDAYLVIYVLAGDDVPLPDPAPDADDDDLADADESSLGTDPFAFDTDGDGFGDGTEVALGTDPLDANDVPVIGQ